MHKLVLLVVVELAAIVLLLTQVLGAHDFFMTARVPGSEATLATGAAAQSVSARNGEDTPRDAAAPRRERAAVAPKWNADDPVGILLVGTIRGRDGSTVGSPSIYFARDDGGVAASASKDGNWAAAGLRPGEWRLNVRADGFASLQTTQVVTDDAHQELDLVLDPAYLLTVRIETPDGKDANAEVAMPLGLHFGFHVVGSSQPIPARLATTDYSIVWVGDANWVRAERPKDGIAGVIELAAPPPAHVAILVRHLVVAQQRVEPGQKEVKFVVERDALAASMARARMRVVDAETGAGLVGATCTLRSTSGGGAHGKADADGKISIENALPGLLIMELNAKDHEQVTTSVRVHAGETTDLGELRLGKEHRCVGRVLDADGKPAAASVQWTELKWRKGPRPFMHNRSTSCDVEGKFELWRAGVGPIAIMARAADGRMAVGVMDNPPAAPVELRLALPGHAVFTRKPDVTQAFAVTLLDAQKRPVASWRLEPRMLRSPMQMPAGEYGFEVHDDADQLVRSGTVRFGATPVLVELP